MLLRLLESIFILLLVGTGCSKKSERATTHTEAEGEADRQASLAPATQPVLSHFGNPFVGVRFYVNPDFTRNVEDAARKASPSEAALVRRVGNNPTAIWLTSIEQAASASHWLDDAHNQQIQTGQRTLTVFVIYDLPNRDCASQSSSGELLLEADGEQRYRSEFIDRIATQFQSHADQPIVVILEPDSLPNLVSNLKNPRCAASENPYKRDIAYAIAKLALPNVSIYLDAAHAGWLGWLDNRGRISTIFKEVLQAAGGVDRIRGFATNVANYTSLSGTAGSSLNPDNPCPNELAYIAALTSSLHRVGIDNVGFLVDTSRNGVDYVRANAGSWCNLARAGIGERPRAAPLPGIDAYYWIKLPGESDGTSDAEQPHHDDNCDSADSMKGAPPAGAWFNNFFISLVRKANPPL